MPDNKKVATGDQAQAFPTPPTPQAERPQPGEPRRAQHYVVLHDGIDAHRKDAIVKGEDLGDADAIKRLLDLGAIRPLEP